MISMWVFGPKLNQEYTSYARVYFQASERVNS